MIIMGLFSCVEVPKTVQHDSSLNFVELSGYKFHTDLFGESKQDVVIVVHGGPGGDFQYLKPLKALSSHYKVVFYDQRGTGLSPRVDSSQLTLEQNIIDLNDVIDHYSNKKPVKIIGHSWGAMLAISYLGQYPEKVSHAVAIEPGMLMKESAIAFNKIMKDHQSISDIFVLIKNIVIYPFVTKKDGHEGFDFVMTQILNRNKPGAPYQCDDQAMPNHVFKRGGYEAFNNMLKPVMDDADLFTYDLTLGTEHYKNKLLMISSECSAIGYKYQNKYHIPKLPPQTIHIEAKKMGHNMLTLNSDWSNQLINNFFSDNLQIAISESL